MTGSSDHHGLGKVDHDLGVNTTDPEQYERLISLAAPSLDAASPRSLVRGASIFDPARRSCVPCGSV